jgi:undecaprenyl diphosphate synthase
MGLLKAFIRRDLAELHAQNVRIRIIGDRHSLRSDILNLLLEAEETTRDNTALTLVIAFNYGSRDEIARAVVSLAEDVEAGRLRAREITPELVNARLDTAGIPDPDLIIRTSGEERLSNFLLWQAAYSEFVFVPEYWPDFGRELFYAALEKFAARDRRFGGLSPQAAAVGT